MEIGNIQHTFAFRHLRKMVEQRMLSITDTIIVVCGGDFDMELFRKLGFTNVVTTNIDMGQVNSKKENVQDARELPFSDSTFDYAFVHAGLHHVDRPHQAVCEMYRVARKGIIIMEAQDSFLVKSAVKMGLVAEYEKNAIIDSGYLRGGVNDGPIPNYVYRWTKREFVKLISSLDPAHEPVVSFDSEWDFGLDRVARRLEKTPVRILPKWLLNLTLSVSVKIANFLTGRQGNLFVAYIAKNTDLKPWMSIEGNSVVFRKT